nr:immunoglobulin heavy chain junction region [Macaca mulatta]MOW50694.1 immunoglobulin heavy chain junction region [Macaca mulatta]
CARRNFHGAAYGGLNRFDVW